MKGLIKSLIPERLRARLSGLRERLLLSSLRSAADEQGLGELAGRLRRIVPDISGQYSGFAVASEFLEAKVRGQHAFQVRLASQALNGTCGKIVDIGDSAGTHLCYLESLYPDRAGQLVSINLDPAAVERIKAKGLKAVRARAEDLPREGLEAEVFLCFETLEHLSDPFAFLHKLSRTGCKRLALTVPYVRRSRVGLHHIRAELKKSVTAESVHFLELSPEDLRLAFRHCGWRIERETVYLQYPRGGWQRLLAPLWRSHDFEGFYGAVLVPDRSWSCLYQDWNE